MLHHYTNQGSSSNKINMKILKYYIYSKPPQIKHQKKEEVEVMPYWRDLQ